MKEMNFKYENFTSEKLLKQLKVYEQESTTEKGFQMIRHTFKKKMIEAGAKGPFADQLEDLFYRFKNKAATKKELLLIGSALFYFIASVDIIPDYLFPVGYLDDAIAVQYVMQSLAAKH